MNLEEAYKIPQLQSKITEIVLKHSSRINWRRDELSHYLKSVNFSFAISNNDVKKLLHKIK